MFLAWTRYGKVAGGTYTLYLIMGEKNGKYVCVEASPMPEEVANLIARRDRVVDNLPLSEKIQWIQAIWPDFINYYKEIYRDNLNIENQYGL